MTAYIITPAQHAQLVDALEGTNSFVKLDEALEMLKAMKPVEPNAWVLFRRDEDGLEPVMFYGGKDKPDLEFKDRFQLREVYAMEPKT